MGLFDGLINNVNIGLNNPNVHDALEFGKDLVGINDALDGNSDNFFAIPETRVLSSQARLRLRTPSVNGAASETLYVGEIDSFNANVNFEVVKQFKPYGHLKTKTLTRHGGWNLSMSGGKVHWAMSYIVYMNERLLLGETNNKSGVTEGNSFNRQLLIGNALIFDFEERVKYIDGTEQVYIYKDVTLLNYSMDMAANNTEIPESISAYCPERIIGEEFSEAVTKMTDKGAEIIGLIQQVNKS